MKLLHWHKLANEAALKAALIRTKKMKAMDMRNPPKESLKEKAEWMQQIIEEEQAKPLQVGKDYIIKYEEEEKRTEAALQRQVEHHVNCLKNLRASIEKRETIRTRKAQFKEFKEQVNAERKAVMEGRIEAKNRFKVKTQPKGGEEEEAAGGKGKAGTLATVISSLDKLVDLEKRISSLESDNMLDRVKDGASVPQQKLARMKLAFAKKRSEPKPGVPAKAFYSVRVKRGNRAQGGRSRQQRMAKSSTTGGRIERIGRSNNFHRTGGNKRLGAIGRGTGRSVATARSRPKTYMEKRDAARIQKSNAQMRSRAGGTKRNVHLQQFHNIRKANKGRIDQIRRKGPDMSTGGAAIKRGGGVRNAAASSTGRRFGGGGGGGSRLSRTTGSRMSRPIPTKTVRRVPAGVRGASSLPNVRKSATTTNNTRRGGGGGAQWASSRGGASKSRTLGPKSRFPSIRSNTNNNRNNRGANSYLGRRQGNKGQGSAVSAVRAKATRKAW